ncbi:MAG: asparagine synthase [Paucibacter sp.]|nr:asparagine synthase [Roseateles sp.]
MPATPLFLGCPRFPDPQARSLAASGRVAEAWQHSLAQGVAAGLASVDGDFACALPLGEHKWLLAVDRFAARSLCYRWQDGQLDFAAAADVLGGPAPDIDPQAIYDYLYFHVIPAPRTIFRHVLRLPPGHYALLENGQLTVAPYWVAEFTPAPSGNFESLAAEFRILLEEAVTRQLDGTTPACFLSGGTDSSTVAGMIGRVSGRPAETYSIGFEAQGYDEMEYARIAARHFGCKHHEYYVTPADLVRSVPAVAASYDQPFGNSSALPAFYCADVARRDGVTRMLAGDGGDELFGGNTRYAKQKVFDAYQGIPAMLRKDLLEPLCETGLMQGLPLLKKGASYVNQAKVPMPDRTATYNQLERLGLSEVLTPQFLAQVDPSAPHRLQREVWAQARGGDLVDRMLAFDWRFTLADCDLPKVVGTTALARVSVGFPMLDSDLLAFSMRLPTRYKVKGLKLRWFFKEALRGFLPDEIITKKKQGFGLPFGVWLLKDAALMNLARDSLQGIVRRGFVHEAFVTRLLEQRLGEHAGYYGEMVWILMMLEQWLIAKAPGYRC